MDDIYRTSMLLDFYGQLLTERQYEILDLHCNNDYSLGEIAQQLNISRQGVFDNVKRAKTALDGLEDKLGLVKKFAEQKKEAEEILLCLGKIDKEVLDQQNRRIFDTIEDKIKVIISNS
ncbi:hypothetical protein DFR58_102103 [Anaerobacterium chartisolvens]|uniref:UPF0122 protein DFR58_102103 n=1 Tax=Anaerobacterium chartisolvens TaxID=1297424 RepID=A0A369BK08_9FIRM|nr:YlxM family DNA-binding protein [Anaerobacterium chartisolvens]RCX20034.1 hypothetical protein DFR58_102103 [Anaerobacterium chartisolvens]